MKKLTKLLSRNDVAETKSHQAGILIPKYGGFLSFFPHLSSSQFNPDILIKFQDTSGADWEFRFIYYNNAKFGGTRNEYRLTRMTRFLKSNNAEPGNGIVLTHDDTGYYYAEIIADPLRIKPFGTPEYPAVLVPEVKYEKEYDLIFDEQWNLTEREVKL